MNNSENSRPLNEGLRKINEEQLNFSACLQDFSRLWRTVED